jgi:methyl-accepting chemotaxis protein
MSGAVDTLTRNLGQISLSAEPGAVDGAVRRESPALDALTSASARAFAERDAVVAELQRCTEGLKELQQLAKQSRELARHTRLVAFNASIEANRTRSAAGAVGAAGGATGTGGAEAGAQAIASELRMLAGRMADSGERLDRVVAGLIGRIADSSRSAHIHDTTPDELRLEIDLRARDALAALLGAVGGSLHGAAEAEQAGSTLREQLEAAFVHFQFGDRISQMLNIVANDMTNFTAWVAANPRATQTDAAEWLAALEASYTMDEQRSSHHGNVVVEHSSGVDFF